MEYRSHKRFACDYGTAIPEVFPLALNLQLNNAEHSTQYLTDQLPFVVNPEQKEKT
jgi:hypothetical protein